MAPGIGRWDSGKEGGSDPVKGRHKDRARPVRSMGSSAGIDSGEAKGSRSSACDGVKMSVSSWKVSALAEGTGDADVEASGVVGALL